MGNMLMNCWEGVLHSSCRPSYSGLYPLLWRFRWFAAFWCVCLQPRLLLCWFDYDNRRTSLGGTLPRLQLLLWQHIRGSRSAPPRGGKHLVQYTYIPAHDNCRTHFRRDANKADNKAATVAVDSLLNYEAVKVSSIRILSTHQRN